MDLKDFKPTTFSGARDQEFKPWRKRFLTYANLQVPGFRAALEWSEKRESEVTPQDLAGLGWARAAEADPALWDFLSLMTSEDALAIVEKVKTQGFEAWRLIHKRFAPSGGRHELKKMLSVFKRVPCKSLKEIPRALDDLEKDIASYNRSTGFTFPEEWKLPMLLEVMPASHRQEIELRYTLGAHANYSHVAKEVLAYANDSRFAQMDRRDPNAMDLDQLRETRRFQEAAANAEAELADLKDDLAAAAAASAAEPGLYSNEEWVDWLGKKGSKGSGKGKGGGKGAARGAPRRQEPAPATAHATLSRLLHCRARRTQGSVTGATKEGT